MASPSSSSDDAWVAAALAEAPPVSVIGAVRVLYVEDDELQQKALVALVETANQQNAGAVTFQLTCASAELELSAYATAPAKLTTHPPRLAQWLGQRVKPWT